LKSFFDTNILVYASVSDDVRREMAEQLLVGGGVISAQVLNEYSNVARKKLKWEWADIAAATALICTQVDQVVPLTAATNAQAIRLTMEINLSFYDALIVAAALAGNCDVLWSEDMQHNRKIEGLTIRNPFADI
jgi:predicted nucleic acid-binding protein